jgi:hypothetical protein
MGKRQQEVNQEKGEKKYHPPDKCQRYGKDRRSASHQT